VNSVINLQSWSLNKNAFSPRVEGGFIFMEKLGSDYLRKLKQRKEDYDILFGPGQNGKKKEGLGGFTLSKRKFFEGLHALNAVEKVVYIGLRLYANKEGHCWPSMRRLAKELALCLNTIRKTIHSLEQKKWLKIGRRRGKGGVRFEYWLLK